MRSFNVHYVTTNFTFKPNSLIDYALCGTSFENMILTSFLTYAATDDDQTNPTKKWNVIQYFCKPQYPFMMYNNVYRYTITIK